MNKRQKICLVIGTFIFDVAGLAFLYARNFYRYKTAAEENYNWAFNWETGDKQLALILIALTTLVIFYALTDDKTKKDKKKKKYKETRKEKKLHQHQDEMVEHKEGEIDPDIDPEVSGPDWHKY